jgi:hypothetical protein
MVNWLLPQQLMMKHQHDAANLTPGIGNTHAVQYMKTTYVILLHLMIINLKECFKFLKL